MQDQEDFSRIGTGPGFQRVILNCEPVKGRCQWELDLLKVVTVDKFLANPGHHTIVRHLSSFLDANGLAQQCRLVCKPFKEIIDSDR